MSSAWLYLTYLTLRSTQAAGYFWGSIVSIEVSANNANRECGTRMLASAHSSAGFAKINELCQVTVDTAPDVIKTHLVCRSNFESIHHSRSNINNRKMIIAGQALNCTITIKHYHIHGLINHRLTMYQYGATDSQSCHKNKIFLNHLYTSIQMDHAGKIR